MKTLRSLALLAMLYGPVVAFADKTANNDDHVELEALQEQIQIMRLVLAKALNSSLLELYHAEYATALPEASEDSQAEDDKKSKKSPSSNFQIAADHYDLALTLQNIRSGTFSTSQLNVQFTSNTRGFYVPGYGVLFDTEIAIPLHESEPSGDGAAERSAWELARRELRGHRVAESDDDQAKIWILHPAYIERAVDVVLECISDYGMNLEVLSDAESIGFAMRFVPSRAHGLPFFGVKEGAARNLLINTYAAGSKSARVQNVVIQVPKHVLREWVSRGDVTVEDLRQGAQIFRYGDMLAASWSAGRAGSAWSRSR